VVAGRGKAIAIALGWTVLYLVLGLLLSTVFAIGIGLILGPAGAPLEMLSHPGPEALLVQGVVALAGFGSATWVVGIKGNRLTAADLRWRAQQPRLAAFGLGVLLGVVPAGLALVLSIAGGGARFVSDTGSLGDYFRQVGLTTLVLAPAALSEEVMFRGVPQVLLARPLGRWGALALTSVLFALAHLLNPDVSPLALANIALAGLFLGAAFYLPGGIWTAFGAHLGWNATLAAADAPVSGLPFPIPWINYQPGGPGWLTGAGFGPEGGLVATTVLALGLAWAIRRIPREES
jgi:membrane protease YdiL (CAAX protease family)